MHQFIRRPSCLGDRVQRSSNKHAKGSACTVVHVHRRLLKLYLHCADQQKSTNADTNAKRLYTSDYDNFFRLHFCYASSIPETRSNAGAGHEALGEGIRSRDTTTNHVSQTSYIIIYITAQ